VKANEIWLADAYDVPEIHAEARTVYERLLDRATNTPPPASGRVMMLLGEAGSGKSHLMRAFRHAAHSSGRGYCGYLQMTSQVSNYSHYVLGKLIDSLSQPYGDMQGDATGLMRLSASMLDAVPGVDPGVKEKMFEGDPQFVHQTAFDLADRLLGLKRLAGCDINLVRALLMLQGGNARRNAVLLSYLRAEDLAPSDRPWIGGLVPRCQEQDAQRNITGLAKLMTAANNSSLVLLVDQLEDIFNLDDTGKKQFRSAIDALAAIGDEVPTSVVVIACLEDYFKANQQHLPKPKLDRLLLDPEPVRLVSQRSHDEVVALVNQRVAALYEQAGLDTRGLAAAYPFTPSQLEPLANLRTRDVLLNCLRHQEQCAAVNEFLAPGWGVPHGRGTGPVQAGTTGAVTPPGTGGAAADATTDLERAWSDFTTVSKTAVADDEPYLARLLSWAVNAANQETPPGLSFHAEEDGQFVQIEAYHGDNSADKLLAAVCNKAARGGGLGRQIATAGKRAGEVPLALVRSAPFPKGTTSAVVKDIAMVVKRGGRLVEAQDADWRAILALQEFERQNKEKPGYKDWRSQFRPLSRLVALKKLLALDELPVPRPTKPEPPPPPLPPAGRPKEAADPGRRQATTPAPEAGPLRIGLKSGLTGGEVALEAEELKLHAAFLGGSGSGKTTAALNIIEQLLTRKVPVILVDRKGDLCRYADPAAWQATPGGPGAPERLEKLRRAIDVAVYTPGHPEGRPLKLPIVPAGTASLPTIEREQIAGYAAGALGGMLNYNPRTHSPRFALLRKAIEALAAMPDVDVGVGHVQRLIEERDAALLTSVGAFNDREFTKVSQDLLALQINSKHLLVGGEALDIDEFFAKDREGRAGRTPLSIISTRFLPDAAAAEFWVAQFLVALNRWCAKSPSNSMQAVVMFDEADLYLPATRQPATKAPMESLLRRARSAGLGVFLATQSPGDMDYKSRDNIRAWFVGRIKENTAIAKLKPMFSEARADPSAKLPGQGTGEFHLLREGEVVAIKSFPSLIRTEQLGEDRILELARQSR
jgi:DNA helicase HerA-like ATPase